MNRFDDMRRVHSLYFPKYGKACKAYKGDKKNEEMIKNFVVGRIGNKIGIRAYVFDKLYKVAGGTKDVSQLLAAIELHIASMYCFNVAADEKDLYISPSKKRVAFETQKIIFKIAKDLVLSSSFELRVKEKIVKVFNDTNNIFLIGEILDTTINLYKNTGLYPQEIIESLDISNKNFANSYGLLAKDVKSILNLLPLKKIKDYTYERTYLVNAAMLENFAVIISLLLPLKQTKLKALSYFGKNYGIGMMIINDVQDYSLDLLKKRGVATKEKLTRDVFNDLKFGKITWPIKFASNDDKFVSEHSKNIRNGVFSSEMANNIRDSLINNGSIEKCILEAAAFCYLANKSLDIFPDSIDKKFLKDTSFSISMLSKYVLSLETKYNKRLRPHKTTVRTRALKLNSLYKREDLFALKLKKEIFLF